MLTSRNTGVRCRLPGLCRRASRSRRTCFSTPLGAAIRMPLTQEQLIEKLNSAGVEFIAHQHGPAMTVEAQVQALPGNPSTVLKNLFLKDKKHRCYIITALAETKIDLQVLSARLGTGKGGIRMAPEDLLVAILQVPLGSVTPLAVANPEAEKVVLLLDHKIKSQQTVYAHPLVNTCSLEMTPAALEAAIRCLGRDPLFVDLEAEPKIDRENPPDLKHISDAAQPPEAALPPADGAAADVPAAPAAAAPGAKPAAPAPAKSGPKADKAKADAAGAANANGAAPATGALDVAVRTQAVLSAACATLLGCSLEEAESSGKVAAYALAQLRADLEMQLTGLKNGSYAAGYVAGKGEMVAFAERRYA